ncbi:Eco29kI family restriction endonuclease [Saccharothrix violaceirubra]|uniref:GIY-YIG domain-containing protein n=1 Tax=Saccharothrix violaceirubra TaxID=413306 RepID=A0A7W7T9W5_9PSEU|nr:Eco29kI family restriction endonuclease [Saccharothrix violaceirubra]MBB4969219.1 hypothetical protein [Saccharothrix violaceirubra]
MTGALFSPMGKPDPDVPAAEFKLNITKALGDQLQERLASLRRAPLTPPTVAAIEPLAGVYELWHGDKRVYVGKATASKGLNQRLSEHLRKLSGRRYIDLAEFTFMCLYVEEDLDAAAPEKLLIKRYRNTSGCPWNNNGFGNKDPGRNRDSSRVKENHFDARYPIDTDREVTDLGSSSWNVLDTLLAAKEKLPFLLRFPTDKTDKAAAKRLQAANITTLPNGPITFRRLMSHVIDALPEGWQATALPGYAIIYQEVKDYDSALTIWRKRSGMVVEEEIKTVYAPAAAIKDSGEDD